MATLKNVNNISENIFESSEFCMTRDNVPVMVSIGVNSHQT